jgi:hypothetical protein
MRMSLQRLIVTRSDGVSDRIAFLERDERGG